MTVKERLFSEPWQFEFFEAVRLVELLHPARKPPGEQTDPDGEAVRLSSAASFIFPASEVQAIGRPEADGAPPSMTVNLFGVAGVQGPLPQPDSERIIEQSWRKNLAFAEFLNIFQHRILSFLVRMRKLHHPSYTAEAPDSGSIPSYLYALFGMATPAMRGRLLLPERSLLFYSGLLAQHPRSGSGLERLLSDYFQTPVRLSQPLGQWRELEASQWTTIGRRGQNQELGSGALLGTRVWDQQGRFDLSLGPMHLALFLDLLPTGKGYSPLCELTRFYAGPDFQFSFRLTLRASDVPAVRLGASHLGWTSWLKRRPTPRDDSQVRLSSRYTIGQAGK